MCPLYIETLKYLFMTDNIASEYCSPFYLDHQLLDLVELVGRNLVRVAEDHDRVTGQGLGQHCAQHQLTPTFAKMMVMTENLPRYFKIKILVEI